MQTALAAGFMTRLGPHLTAGRHDFTIIGVADGPLHGVLTIPDMTAVDLKQLTDCLTSMNTVVQNGATCLLMLRSQTVGGAQASMRGWVMTPVGVIPLTGAQLPGLVDMAALTRDFGASQYHDAWDLDLI